MAVKAQKYQGVKVHIIGIYMSTAFHTINRNDLVQELGTFSDEGECRTTQVLLSNTTIFINQKFLMFENAAYDSSKLLNISPFFIFSSLSVFPRFFFVNFQVMPFEFIFQHTFQMFFLTFVFCWEIINISLY